MSNIPGWLKLDREKQGKLFEHTSHIQQYLQMQRLGEFGCLLELTQVHQLLEYEEMKMTDYLRFVYPARHPRTIYRKLQAFQDLSTSIPNSVLKRITGLGHDVLSKFERISQAALGDIRNALHKMPLLPVNTDEAAEKYLKELDTELLKERKDRRAKGKQDKNQAARKATRDVLGHLRDAGLKDSAEKRQWLARVFGWVMEDQNLIGTLRPRRIPVPDGILVRRGRPPKKRFN